MSLNHAGNSFELSRRSICIIQKYQLNYTDESFVVCRRFVCLWNKYVIQNSDVTCRRVLSFAYVRRSQNLLRMRTECSGELSPQSLVSRFGSWAPFFLDLVFEIFGLGFADVGQDIEISELGFELMELFLKVLGRDNGFALDFSIFRDWLSEFGFRDFARSVRGFCVDQDFAKESFIFVVFFFYSWIIFS